MSLIDLHSAPRKLLCLMPSRIRSTYARLDEAYCMETAKIILALVATGGALWFTGIDTFLSALGFGDLVWVEAPGPTAPAANLTGVVEGMCDETAIAEDEDIQPVTKLDTKGTITRAPAALCMAP